MLFGKNIIHDQTKYQNLYFTVVEKFNLNFVNVMIVGRTVRFEHVQWKKGWRN